MVCEKKLGGVQGFRSAGEVARKLVRFEGGSIDRDFNRVDDFLLTAVEVPFLRSV